MEPLMSMMGPMKNLMNGADVAAAPHELGGASEAAADAAGDDGEVHQRC